MAIDRRKKDLRWNVADGDGNTYNDIKDGVSVAVLMDIRDELQRLNQLLHCQNFQNVPRELRAMHRELAKIRKGIKS